MPGTTPPTSQLDWLSSTTAMIVLSWSRATRDLLKSFGWGIAALHRLDCSDEVAISRRPPHSISWFRASSGLRARAQMLFDQLVDPRRRFGLGQVATAREHHERRIWHRAGEQLGICRDRRHSIFFTLD